MKRTTHHLMRASVAIGLVMALIPASASAHRRGRGVLTDVDPYVTLTGEGSLLPIITVGETIGGFTFEGIPDGIGLTKGKRGTVDMYVAHEQSTVAFPPLSGIFGPPLADFENASVSKLSLNRRSAGVVRADVALPASAGFIRFCSAFMAGRAEGFSTPTFFVNEESGDVIDVPADATFGPDPAFGDQRQAGFAVALNTRNGKYTPIPGLGRYNHENTIVVPGGWDRTVAVLSTDDTFSGPSAQLYLYLARKGKDVFKDKGHLWAFRVTAKNGSLVEASNSFNNANDYLDLQPGDDMQGEFIRVPDDIADGTTAVAPQQGLEDWSNANNIFQFIRLEDVATDKHNPRIVYIADTGRSRVVPDATTGRLVRGSSGTVGQADSGSVFKMEFNEDDPRLVDSLTVLAQGDDSGGDDYVGFVSPDNVGVSEQSLMVQEDTADAKIWRHDLDTGSWTVVAQVNDTASETSGIVDASKWFGDGTWLFSVQAHGTFQSSEIVDNPENPALPLTTKREDGQIILMTIPES